MKCFCSSNGFSDSLLYILLKLFTIRDGWIFQIYFPKGGLVLSKDAQIKNSLILSIYADALGFVRESLSTEVNEFIPFQFQREENLIINLEAGQWSDLTEYFLILLKCLIDQRDESKVIVDYKRLKEELKLWKDYRHGSDEQLLKKIEQGKNYYQLPQYWEDKRGYGISRVMMLFLGNKNYATAQEEAFKQIIYLNRHPEVVITGLLIIRTMYLLLDNSRITLEELINELKLYLIELVGSELEANVEQVLPTKYPIHFEKEKINYLMALDRLINSKEDQFPSSSSSGTFLAALLNLFRLKEGLPVNERLLPKEDAKESLVLTYGFWGISETNHTLKLEGLKDWTFINNMGDYIGKIRNYEINRKGFISGGPEIDIYELKVGNVFKHPVLNVTKVVSKKENHQWMQVVLETKATSYVFYKKK